MEQTFHILGFTEILEELKERASSPKAKKMLEQLAPYLSETELRKNLRETTQGRQMLELEGTPPLPAMERTEEYVERAVRGEMLLPGEIGEIGTFLAAVRRMKSYLERGKTLQISLAYYEENLSPMEELREEIERSIRGDAVDDYASALLSGIRRELCILEEKITEKAEAALRANKQYIAESFIVKRNGRICLPIRKEYKARVAGTVVDRSSTGSTLFIEPNSVERLREQIDNLKIDEDGEVRRILYTLTDQIAEEEERFRENLNMLSKLDYVFAKAKLSVDMNAVEPSVNTDGYVDIRGARHPSLAEESCVPLDFKLGKGQRGIVITGPNTGGKTVAIKTVGLLALMAGCGLHVPCKTAALCMFNQILCDIGDGQNIADNLSTFSAHITNVMEILKKATGESLVILDELGSGTDPAEGMGIAVAILEQLRMSGCLFLVTTHYPEVKMYASEHGEILNARMAFDRNDLKPLYRLEIGKAGESCALYIAKRLGMPGEMLRAAAGRAYGGISKELERELEIGEPGMPQDETRKEARSQLLKVPVPALKLARSAAAPVIACGLKRGDSVTVLPENFIGIVVKPADEKGNVLVQIKGEKKWLSHKRLKLKAAAEELYPEDYDFSIIFDTVENRKARHQMDKRHQPGLEIRYEKL